MDDRIVASDASMAAPVALREGREKFDPRPYMIAISGSREPNYLKVVGRIAWFRVEHPDGIIETRLISYDGEEAVFVATVSIPGGGSATGHGSETRRDFPSGPLEKAESKAIGRAIAALGYGTLQVGEEFDEGESAETGQPRIADAPVGRQARLGDSTRPVPPRGQPPRQQQASAPPDGAGLISERQVKFAYALAREAGLDDQELSDWCQELYDQPDVTKLNRRDASTLIEALQRRRQEIS